jgi:hypothetical protein
MDCSFDSDDGADSCLEESDFTSISRRGPNAATTECFVVYANITIEVSGCVVVDVDVDFFFHTILSLFSIQCLNFYHVCETITHMNINLYTHICCLTI